jgi:ATP-dependent protease ClpP protease subunit
VDIPKGAPIVYISFSAEIRQLPAETLIATLANCANAQVKQVYLLLSTFGGNVTNGFNLYNLMKGMPFELITHNVGSINSIGNVVFLAGSKRYATSHSTFMFHGVGFDIQNQRFEEKDLQEKLNGLQNDQQRIANLIAQHTSITESEITEFFRTGQTKDALFAKDKGIIHEIRDVTLSPNYPIVTLVFQRQ